LIFQSIETHNFRNLDDQVVEPRERFVVLAGENAQGKTNFLEALHLICCQRSFFAIRNAEMISFGESSTKVSASVEALSLERKLEVSIGPSGKKVSLDGKQARGGDSSLKGLSVVLFTPDDLQVPRGGPALRRRMLDRSIAGVWPAYGVLVRDYQKVLQNRNKVLHRNDHTLLEVYNEQLAQLGSRVVAGRRRYVQGIQDQFVEAFSQIIQSGVRGELAYRTTGEVDEAGDRIDDLQQALLSQLQKNTRQDLARGSTSSGPHTDDLEFLLDGRNTRSFGSQGQVRTMVLSLRIAQITNTYEKLGFYPVLLLDDVSSELDDSRREYLFEFIAKISCQTILTTTRPDLIELRSDREDYQVVRGKITPSIQG